jgi:hypothetical protein
VSFVDDKTALKPCLCFCLLINGESISVFASNFMLYYIQVVYGDDINRQWSMTDILTSCSWTRGREVPLNAVDAMTNVIEI